MGAELAAVRSERDRLAGEVQRLRAERAALAAKLDEARRAAKRQAAPFSRGRRTAEGERRRPGRKPGADHGRHGHRRPPAEPELTLEAPLPDACAHCGSAELEADGWAEQFQDEIVTSVVRRRILVEMARCRGCRRRVQGRHPEQTSDAFGAAGTMLGPRAVALAAWLHHGCGLPAAKIARLYGCLGLSVTASGITQAMCRLADDATGTYRALIEALRASTVVSPDETGWRIDGQRGWLWAFVGDTVTVYDIAVGPGARGHEIAADILGADFDGTLCRDGWAAYRFFAKATHQSCVAHLLRRANELIADSRAGQARIPHAVRRLLVDALALRARRDTGHIGGQALEQAIAELEARADRICASRPTHEPNRRLVGHLTTERDALFTFLRQPGTPATNHEAERAIRPQVCARKNWGGNKTERGARAHAINGSVIRTAAQQGADPIVVMMTIATSDGKRHGLNLVDQAGP